MSLNLCHSNGITRTRTHSQNRLISSVTENHSLRTSDSHKTDIFQPRQANALLRKMVSSPQCKILPNGATLVTHSLVPQSKISTVGVWMKFGSRISVPGIPTEGLVHFMEHMIFKGTKARSKQDIERWIENKGAHLNAYTTKEHVAYFGNCLGSDTGDMLELLLDLLQNSLFTNTSVRDEINTILREAHEVNLIAEEVLLDKVHEQCFGPESDLGTPILGRTAAIRGTTKTALSKLMKAMYVPANMVIIAVGDIDPKRIESVTNKCLAHAKDQNPNDMANNRQISVPHFNGGYSLYVQQALDLYLKEPTLLVARTCPGISWNSPNFFVSILGRMMLMASDTAPGEQAMVQGCRTRVPTSLPAVSEIGHYLPFDAFYKDCGLFGTYALEKVPERSLSEISRGQIPSKISDETKAEIKKVACEGGLRIRDSLQKRISLWNAESLDKAKEMCITTFAATVNNPLLEPEELGRQILSNGRLSSHDEIKAQIEKVQLADTKRLFDALLINPPSTAITALLRIPLVPLFHRR